MLEKTVKRMAHTLIHRGPDDRGTWVDEKVGLAFGHTRLSILDLTSEGHQPMWSQDGRYVIVYNGEIYNFKDLRNKLKRLGNSFRGTSDTEVILTSINEWGIQKSLKYFDGMFSFAVWDKVDRILYLARDRIGEKPMYYGWQNNIFFFGSELKALKAHPDFNADISLDAVSQYIQLNYVPAPLSIYKSIFKLSPGSLLIHDEGNHSIKIESYWSAQDVISDSLGDGVSYTEYELIDQLENILLTAVKSRMVSDVPLGAFLSGGIDSSTIVAMMQYENPRPVKTFTIGFYEKSHDEAKYAKAVANYLGTDHTELYITEKDSLNVIPKLPTLYDEPFSDSSQIPTFLISELARSKVTVSLSGDGGDELFGGYNRHIWNYNYWGILSRVPISIRKLFANVVNSVSISTLDRAYNLFYRLLPSTFHVSYFGDKLHKFSDIVSLTDSRAFYKRLISNVDNSNDILVNSSLKTPSIISNDEIWNNFSCSTDTMMFYDLITYLPDDILVKVDRASMGVGLESRAPYLDHKVVEFAWKIPTSMKIHNGSGKWILRKVLNRYIPDMDFQRPKMGFGIPIDKWLKNELKDWAESLLQENRLKEEGFFDYKLVHNKWREHLEGTRNNQYFIWNILMFQAWLDSQMSSNQ